MKGKSGTKYNSREMQHIATLDPPHRNFIFLIKVQNYKRGSDLDQLIITIQSEIKDEHSFRFYFSDMITDERDISLATFIIPTDLEPMTPPYNLSIIAEDNEFDLSKYQFGISWEPIVKD